jgi:hypothetical protein
MNFLDRTVIILLIKIYLVFCNENQDYEILTKNDASTFSTPSYLIFRQSSTPSESNDDKKNVKLISTIVRTQLKKEIRKLKSGVTDSILEELINYYGKRLESIDLLKDETKILKSQLHTLTQNFNNLGQNFKSISRNHRNLVDVVRNNFLNNAKQAKQKTIESNLKKKSVEQINTTQVNEDSYKSLKNKIKNELLTELETKYRNFLSLQPEKPKIQENVLIQTTTKTQTTTTEAQTTEITFDYYKNVKNPNGKLRGN